MGGQQVNQWRNSRRWYSLCVWPHAPYPWSMPRYYTESAPSTLSISISVMKMNHKIKLVQGLVFNDCHNRNQFCLAVIDGESLLLFLVLYQFLTRSRAGREGGAGVPVEALIVSVCFRTLVKLRESICQ